ncbi:DUF2637 domain-containing protein [Streptomyces sp. TLI_146]|uniref:DUF2637 domain-containing protein n=1 Tax=Streptomyces sp. TLI_146 TaxID=1938858 RepID=UPI000C70F395|nr:uncharacterized protein DUF2637 [Streptomyces sp. TLI_146]
MTHRTTAHPAVAPVGFWDRLAIVVLGLAGCALSYDALQQMAVAIHIRGFLTYLFPLVIDGFIAYGVRALLVLSEAPLRARLYVWVLFGTATAASIWANALHAVRLNQQTVRSGLQLGDTVVAVLSTLAPLALAGAVHLYILITRYHPADQDPAETPTDHPAVRGATGSTGHLRSDHTKVDHGDGQATHNGPPEGSGPVGADQSGLAGQMPDRERTQAADHDTRTTNQPADSAPPDQRTNPAPDRPDHEADQVADHGAPAADQQIAAGPQEADSERRTSSSAGQVASGPDGPADHKRADRVHGPADGSGPGGADHGAPADQMPDREHPPTADHDTRTADQLADSAPPDQRTNPAPDRPDHEADQPLEPLADQVEGGSSGGPQGAQTTALGTPAPDQRAKPADQDEVPWEAKVAVAREAALGEGRMTRRAIRPHLRNAGITVSNELFSDIQAALYADPALAHLPRDTRRAR